MKKTDVKNIAGGTKTTVTKPDGSKTITYDGVNNLHIGRTFTYGVPSSSHAATTSNHNTWKQQSSTGVTFKKVDSLQLNSKEINKMLSSKDHKTYANSKDYCSSQSTSSKNNQSEQSYTSSFKR